MPKIVINTDPDGTFRVSEAVWEELGVPYEERAIYYTQPKHNFHRCRGRGALYQRDDPKLVAAVEKIGSEAASGFMAKLKVVTWPDDDWMIWGIDCAEAIGPTPLWIRLINRIVIQPLVFLWYAPRLIADLFTHSLTKEKIIRHLWLLLLFSTVQADILFEIDLQGPEDISTEFMLTGTVTNTGTDTLGVIGGFLGEPAGYDYEVGAQSQTPRGHGFSWPPYFLTQFDDVNLLPGESFDFDFMLLNPVDVNDSDTYRAWLELQLFPAPRPSDMIAKARSEISWTTAGFLGTTQPDADNPPPDVVGGQIDTEDEEEEDETPPVAEEEPIIVADIPPEEIIDQPSGGGAMLWLLLPLLLLCRWK